MILKPRFRHLKPLRGHFSEINGWNGLRIQPVDATLLLLTQCLVCCIHRLNPHRQADA